MQNDSNAGQGHSERYQDWSRSQVERMSAAFEKQQGERLDREGVPREFTAGWTQSQVDLLDAAKHPVGVLINDDSLREFGIFAGDMILLDEDFDREPEPGELVLADVGELGKVHVVPYDPDADMIVMAFYITYEPRAPRRAAIGMPSN